MHAEARFGTITTTLAHAGTMHVAGGGLLGSVFLALKARGARFDGTIYLFCAAAAAAALGGLAYLVSSAQPLLQQKSTAEEEAAPEPAAVMPAKPGAAEAADGGADDQVAAAREQRKSTAEEAAPEPAAAMPAKPGAAKAADGGADGQEAAARDAARAELARRVSSIEMLLAQLRPTTAGSEERRRLVLDLFEALQDAAARRGKEQRALVRAFVDGGGPEIIYQMESSMTGDWVRDAKNGTLQHLSNMSRLPGPIGQALCAYRRVAEKNKLDAAHGLACEHTAPSPSTT